MAEVSIDAPLLVKRLQSLATLLTEQNARFGGAASVAFLHGKHVDAPMALEPYAVSAQRFLLGYEFPDTIVILANHVCYVHATAKKLDHLRAAAELSTKGGSTVRIELVAREKGPANAEAEKRLVEALVAAGGPVGIASSDNTAGVPEAFLALASAADVKTVDATRGIELFLGCKDVEAAEQVRKAGALVARVARNVFVKHMEAVIDAEKAETNAGMADHVASSIDALEKHKVQVEGEDFDFLLQPIVQSGGTYNTHVEKPGLVSTSDAFASDVIIFSAAMRWKQHAALVARTYFVDPSPVQQRVYDTLHEIQAVIMSGLKPGAAIADVIGEAQTALGNMPDMPVDAAVRNFGCGVGIRCIDKALQLSAKSDLIVRQDMAFSVTVGLSGIKLTDALPESAMAKLSTYSIVISDTVIVGPKGGVCVTDKVPSARSEITYTLLGGDDEEEDEDDAADARKGRSKPAVNLSELRGGRTQDGRSARLAARAADADHDEAARKEREERQLALFNAQREKALQRLRGEGDEDDRAAKPGDDEIARAPEIVAYSSPEDYPKTGRSCTILVDKARDALLLPIFGTLVPFHISTIKSVVKSDEGHKAFLRINFYSAAQSLGKDAPPSMVAAVMRNPDAMFIRTLNFMSRDHRNFGQVEQMFKAMQKKHRADRAAAQQQANLVEQHKLIPTRDARVPKMQDIAMWPAISGRKTTGTLEAHTNGLRFVSSKGEKIDIVYGNIRHGIFQPCEKEHVVLLHFHLRNAIMIGKKKFKDIQFFTEVVEASQALDGRLRSDYDQDEFHAEERERKLRVELNRAFKKFVERVEEVAGGDPTNRGFNSFDVPQRGIGFNGAPFKEMSFILPCSACIVSVVDKPPFVASNDDMDHVHFERVIHGSKNFDMVIIFREGTREKGEESFQRITAIPMQQLEGIKAWLTDIAEVTYSESTNPYNWKSIIEDVVRKPDFYLSEDEETGEKKPAGWGFLTDEGWRRLQGSDGEDDDDEEEGSDFADELDSEEEEEDDDDEDDFSENVDDEDDDEDDDDDDDDEEDEEGEDWDELEKKAETEDKKRKRIEEDEEAEERARRGGKAKSSSEKGHSSSKHHVSSKEKDHKKSRH